MGGGGVQFLRHHIVMFLGKICFYFALNRQRRRQPWFVSKACHPFLECFFWQITHCAAGTLNPEIYNMKSIHIVHGVFCQNKSKWIHDILLIVLGQFSFKEILNTTTTSWYRCTKPTALYHRQSVKSESQSFSRIFSPVKAYSPCIDKLRGL